MYKDFERKSGFPVDGNDISKLAPGTASALAPVPFVEIILIHEAVGSRVALDAANSIGTSHGRIIGGQASEVNAASTAKTVPNWNNQPELKFKSELISFQKLLDPLSCVNRLGEQNCLALANCLFPAAFLLEDSNLIEFCLMTIPTSSLALRLLCAGHASLFSQF